MSESDYTLADLAEAEIVPSQGGTNSYLVRFGEGEYDLVNKSAKNTLILKDDVLTSDVVSYGGIMVDFDLEGDEVQLSNGDDTVRVPPEKHEHVLWAVHDEDGRRLNKLFDELYVPTVRIGLLDQFMPRFRENKTDIKKTDDGWLVGGDILVEWDGSNHPVDVATTHVVRGGETVEADTDKQAREINMPPLDGTDTHLATAPDGRTFELDPIEVTFLTTVGLILGRNPSMYDDDLSRTIENSNIVGFTDTKSGLHHNHPIKKHTLDSLGVTEEAIDRLWYHEYDHTGVHELHVRRDEFETAPIDVFENAANDDPDKWRMIENTSRKAPIPKHVRQDLEERYN